MVTQTPQQLTTRNGDKWAQCIRPQYAKMLNAKQQDNEIKNSKNGLGHTGDRRRRRRRRRKGENGRGGGRRGAGPETSKRLINK